MRLCPARGLFRDEGGFTILESTIALVIIFGVVLTLLRTLDTGVRMLVETRRQAAASAFANELLERARSLEWEHTGLTAKSQDADCPGTGDGVDGVACPTWAGPFGVTTDADGDYTFEGDKIIFINTDVFDPFLSFHDVEAKDDTTFDRYLFVTSIPDGTAAERFRKLTAIVQWVPPGGFRKEVRQVTYVSPFEEPSQPFLQGSVDLDGGFLAVAGLVEGTSDWVDPTAGRPDLAASVQLPEVQLSAHSDYVSGASVVTRGSAGDVAWSDGASSSTDPEEFAKRADDDFGSAPPVNDPSTGPHSFAAWSMSDATRGLLLEERNDAGTFGDNSVAEGEAWTQYTDDLPHGKVDLDGPERLDLSFQEYDGVGTTSSAVYYLKGDGVPQASLSTTAPTASTLPNYDPGRDAFPGLLIQKGGSGAGETNGTKYQLWSTSGGISLGGPVSLRFWSAMKDFDTDKDGHVRAFLLDCADSSCSSFTQIAQGEREADDWSASGTWEERDVSFGSVVHSVAPSRFLGLKLVVGDDSDDDMWFAYDTTSYPSRLSMSAATTYLGTPYTFTLVRYGDAGTSGPAVEYEGVVDRYQTDPASRRVDVQSFAWDVETVYFGMDNAYDQALGGNQFAGWVKVELPRITGSVAAGEAAPAPSFSGDHVVISVWDPTASGGSGAYVELFDQRYDTLSAAQTVTASVDHTLAFAGYPKLRYQVAADLTVNPRVSTEEFDGNGARSLTVLQAPSIVVGEISYVVDDTEALQRLYDLRIAFDLGRVDATAHYVNPEAP